ncbi:hypothetical protein ACLB2K_012234 [Fragaria x ananassa]
MQPHPSFSPQKPIHLLLLLLLLLLLQLIYSHSSSRDSRSAPSPPESLSPETTTPPSSTCVAPRRDSIKLRPCRSAAEGASCDGDMSATSRSAFIPVQSSLLQSSHHLASLPLVSAHKFEFPLTV